MNESDHTPLYYGGAALFVLVLVELVNRRPLVDIIALVLMVIVVLVVAGVYIARGRRKGESRAETRAWAQAEREAEWEPVLGSHQGRDAIMLVRLAELDGITREVEPPRLFEELPSQHGLPEGAWDAHFAEAIGRAGNRAAVLNASRR